MKNLTVIKKLEQEKNAKSVMATYELLLKAIEAPSKAPLELLIACKSQNSLAALCSNDFEILSMSLNTFKSHANNIIGISWDSINRLRKAVYIAYLDLEKTGERQKKHTKDFLESQYAEIKDDRQLLINNVVQFIDRYHDLIKIVSNAALYDSDLNELLLKHLKRYSYLDAPNHLSGKLRLLEGGKHG